VAPRLLGDELRVRSNRAQLSKSANARSSTPSLTRQAAAVTLKFAITQFMSLRHYQQFTIN
jgi:hypothetical protein